MNRVKWMAVAVILAAVASTVGAGDAASLMTQGKLDADMGRRADAAKAFEAVAGDETTPAGVRAEALVRLGLVRRDAGDEKGAYRAFARVWEGYREDPETVALLVQALGGALPGTERWSQIWRSVVVEIHPEQGIARIEWPEVAAPAGPSHAAGPGPIHGAASPSGSPAGFRSSTSPSAPHDTMNLDFKDGDLQDVFRLFADFTGLNVVVHPGTQGRVTFRCKDMPWEEALGRILAPNGLAYAMNGPVLEIGAPDALPHPREFRGKADDFDFKGVALEDALRQVADRGGRRLTAIPGLAGNVTLKLDGVPWDQAFDLVARVNGLDWKDDGKTIRVGLRGTLD
jgi:hypothetical protein